MMFCIAQAQAMRVLGSNQSVSKGSMWMQVWNIVKFNFEAYHEDQGRETPLLSSALYRSMLAKTMDTSMINRLLDEVTSLCAHVFAHHHVSVSNTIKWVHVCLRLSL